MGGVQKYLTRKVQEGEISKDSLHDSQKKLSLLNQAPSLVLSAIAKGWMSYPVKLPTITEEEEVAKWIDAYDCERAYRNRIEGMTYREIGKLMGCGIARVVFAGHSLGGALAHLLNAKSLLTKEAISSSSVGFGFTLITVNAGAYSITWPASVDWVGGSAPILTSSGTDVLVFYTDNGGTKYYGFVTGKNLS